jgi:hypothetical protein
MSYYGMDLEMFIECLNALKEQNREKDTMLCYKDMAFCKPKGAECSTTGCFRHINNTEENYSDLPVALVDFSNTCPEYKPVQDEEE